MIRFSTLDKLFNFQNSKISLGQSLKQNLESDPVSPVLLDAHYEAVDRRVHKILEIIRNCFSKAENANEIIFTHDENYDSGYNAIDDEDAFLNSNGH